MLIMLETHNIAAPAKRLDGWAQNVAILLAFLLPLFFLPGTLIPFAYGKVALVALLAIVPFVLWIIARLKEGTFLYPNSYVLWSAVLLPVVYFVSALLSGDISNSLIGLGLENDTFVFVLILVAVFAMASLLFTSVSSVIKMVLAISSSFTVIATIQTIRLVFGAQNILPGVFSSDVTATILGSWNDLAVFAGLIVIFSLTFMLYAPKTRITKIVACANMVMAFFLLVVINLKVLWFILAALSLVLLLYVFATKHEDEIGANRQPRVRVVAPSVIFVLSVIFIFAGGSIVAKVADVLHVQNVDVRPSWGGTMEVAKQAYAKSPIFGTGPATFAKDWINYKPVGVNNTRFWNVDFSSGVGALPTAFVTTGLVGGAIWILFFASIVYLAFRMLWARMPNDATKYVIFATVGATIYMLLLMILYVPQTVMLAITFLLIGLTLAVGRNTNIVKTNRISMHDSQSTKFVILLVFAGVGVTLLSITILLTQRVVAASMLESSANAAADKDYVQSELLANRVKKITSNSIFGADDRADNILAQLGVLKLRKVLSSDQQADGYKAMLQAAIESVITPARNAIADNPSSYANHIFLGNIYSQLVPLKIDGAYDASMSEYKKALELNPTNPSIPLMMSRLALGSGKLDEATSFANQSLKIKPNYSDAYFMLSQIALKSNNVQEAIASTESAAVLAPNNPGILFQLGMLRYSTKDYEKAGQIFSRAVALNPQYSNALYYLGLTAQKLGDNKTALRAFQKVSKLNPENKEVKQIIESLKQATQKSARAKQDSGVDGNAPKAPAPQTQ